jgi:hypothetical protein
MALMTDGPADEAVRPPERNPWVIAGSVLWAVVPLISFGVLTWAAFLFAAARADLQRVPMTTAA